MALPVSTWERDSLMVVSNSTELAHLSGNSASSVDGVVFCEVSGVRNASSRALAASSVLSELSSLSDDSLLVADKSTVHSNVSGEGGAQSRGSSPGGLLVLSGVKVSAPGLL